MVEKWFLLAYNCFKSLQPLTCSPHPTSVLWGNQKQAPFWWFNFRCCFTRQPCRGAGQDALWMSRTQVSAQGRAMRQQLPQGLSHPYPCLNTETAPHINTGPHLHVSPSSHGMRMTWFIQQVTCLAEWDQAPIKEETFYYHLRIYFQSQEDLHGTVPLLQQASAFMLTKVNK